MLYMLSNFLSFSFLVLIMTSDSLHISYPFPPPKQAYWTSVSCSAPGSVCSPDFGKPRERTLFSAPAMVLSPHQTPLPPPANTTERPIWVVWIANPNADLKSLIFTCYLLSIHLLVKRCHICRCDFLQAFCVISKSSICVCVRVRACTR